MTGAEGKPSFLAKRSVSLHGHATSLAIEPEFWSLIEGLARSRGLSLAAVIAQIDDGRAGRPLASACRLAALEFARTR